jgi:hypothetical protein
VYYYKIIADSPASASALSAPVASVSAASVDQLVEALAVAAAKEGRPYADVVTALKPLMTGKLRTESDRLRASFTRLNNDIVSKLDQHMDIETIKRFILERVLQDLGFKAIYLWDVIHAGASQRDRLPAPIVSRYASSPHILCQLIYGSVLTPTPKRTSIHEYPEEQRKLFDELLQKT